MGNGTSPRLKSDFMHLATAQEGHRGEHLILTQVHLPTSAKRDSENAQGSPDKTLKLQPGMHFKAQEPTLPGSDFSQVT